MEDSVRDEVKGLARAVRAYRRRNSGKVRLGYPDELRMAAAKLLGEGRATADELQAETGMSANAIRGWVRRKSGASVRPRGRGKFLPVRVRRAEPGEQEPTSRTHSVSGPYGLVASELSLLELAWLWQYLLRLDLSDPNR